MFDIPVLLITFNRPNHLKRVLCALREQKPQELYIFQDGPRRDRHQDQELVVAVRSVIDEMIDWPCNVHKRYSDCNLGCGPGPVDGITWFFQNVEYGIIIWINDHFDMPEIFLYRYLRAKMWSDISARNRYKVWKLTCITVYHRLLLFINNRYLYKLSKYVQYSNSI